MEKKIHRGVEIEIGKEKKNSEKKRGVAIQYAPLRKKKQFLYFLEITYKRQIYTSIPHLTPTFYKHFDFR